MLQAVHATSLLRKESALISEQHYEDTNVGYEQDAN